ncbi:MAG: glucose-6-phosphate isomerase [Campylobacteraceae bacterium]|nr:glucose-6-phosphate isomerase [Campylobacteraceae bacterium]
MSKFREKMTLEYNSNEVGYYHLPKNGDKIINDAKEWQKTLPDIRYVVVIGVGGSSLGAKAVLGMLSHEQPQNAPLLLFLENIDPIGINKTLSKIDFSKTLFLLISKSGTTLDTVSIAKIVMERFKTRPLDSGFERRFAVITDENSALHKFASEYNLKTFFIPQNVGGRFSFLSAVGLVPLTLCGFDTAGLLKGAAQCLGDFFDAREDTILQKAYAYTNAAENINVLFSYSDIFRGFNEWYIQLWAESLGKQKEGKRVGLTPVGLIGAIDQHSFLQLIVEGVRDKSVTFVRVKEMAGDMPIPDFSLKYLEKADLKADISATELLNEQEAATMQSVLDEGVRVDEITLERPDAFHVGYLMYYYELLTSACGIILDINTYNQPGVEIGKKILLKKLGK